MKKIVWILLFIVPACFARAHDADSAKLYTPSANAVKEIADAVTLAKQTKKHVLIQAGGNWCSWCIEFNRITKADPKIDSAMKADYIVYHLNYSPENKNYEVFKKYGFPQRFGFPVFLILDGNGALIHTENSSYLEKEKSYDKRKILEFLGNWRPQAFNEANYGYAK